MIFRAICVRESQLLIQPDGRGILRRHMDPKERVPAIPAEYLDDLPDRFRGAVLPLMLPIDQQIGEFVTPLMQGEIQADHAHDRFAAVNGIESAVLPQGGIGGLQRANFSFPSRYSVSRRVRVSRMLA